MAFSKLPEPKLPGILSKRLGTLEGKLEAKALTTIDSIKQDLLTRATNSALDMCPSPEEIDDLYIKINGIKDLLDKVSNVRNRYANLVLKIQNGITTLSATLTVLENIIFPPLIPIPSGTINSVTQVVRDLVNTVKTISESLAPVLESLDLILAQINRTIVLAEAPLKFCRLNNSLDLDQRLLNKGLPSLSELVRELVKRDFDQVPKERIIKKALAVAGLDPKQYRNINYRNALNLDNITTEQEFTINNPSSKIEVLRVVDSDEEISEDYNNFLIYSGSINNFTGEVIGEWTQVSFNLQETLRKGVVDEIENAISQIDLSSESDKRAVKALIDSLLEESNIVDMTLPSETYKGFTITIQTEPKQAFYDYISDVNNLRDLDPNVVEQLEDLEIRERVNANIPRYRPVAYYFEGEELVPVVVGPFSYANNFKYQISEVRKIIEDILYNNFTPNEYINNFFQIEYSKINPSENRKGGDRLLREKDPIVTGNSGRDSIDNNPGTGGGGFNSSGPTVNSLINNSSRTQD